MKQMVATAREVLKGFDVSVYVVVSNIASHFSFQCAIKLLHYARFDVLILIDVTLVSRSSKHIMKRLIYEFFA